MEPTNKYVSASDYHALQVENEKLKQRNANLYRDCVSFAKLIKAGSKKDERIEELLEEVQNLNAQITNLRAQNEALQNPILSDNDGAQATPENIYSDSQTQSASYDPNAVKYISEDEFNAIVSEEETEETKKKEKKKKKKKKTTPRKFFRTLVCILFIISLLISIVSGISYLFSTKYKDYTVNGYRFFTVWNGAMTPEVSKDDILLVKYCGFDGLEIDSLVMTTLNNRSAARITGLSVDGSESIATMKDKNGNYDVNKNEFIGKVVLKIPFLGKVARYASANPYNYLTILISSTLIFFAIFLIIPSKSAGQPKFGKDYTAEEFTI